MRSPWAAAPAVSFPPRCSRHPTLLPAREFWSPQTPMPAMGGGEERRPVYLATGEQIHKLSSLPIFCPDPVAGTCKDSAPALRLWSSVEAGKE